MGNCYQAKPWETEFKQTIRPDSESYYKKNGIEIINIEAQHALKVSDLPLHHRDPFDRLIIAQSLALGYTIVSKDNKFDLYSIDRVW